MRQKISAVASILNMAAERCRIHGTTSHASYSFYPINSNTYGCDAIQESRHKHRLSYQPQEKAQAIFQRVAVAQFGACVNRFAWWPKEMRSQRVRALKAAAREAIYVT